MDSSTDSLSGLQREVLAAFFRLERGFFLTGGAALAGFHLGHRTTTDLDLFTRDDAAWERARGVMSQVALELGLTLDVRQDAPGFRRYVAQRPGEGLVIDLVREYVEAVHGEALEIEGIRVDSAREILVNKLTTLVSRVEIRDLVDVMMLEATGLDVTEELAAAERKDGGCTAATLAWLLAEFPVPAGDLPGGVSRSDLIRYRDELVLRLRRRALPRAGPSQGS